MKITLIYLDNFYIKLESNLIQIGANASIGYGFCRIADVNPKKDI